MDVKKKYIFKSSVLLVVAFLLLLTVIFVFICISNNEDVEIIEFVNKGILYYSQPVYEDDTPVKPEVLVVNGLKVTESDCLVNGGAITFNSNEVKVE